MTLMVSCPRCQTKAIWENNPNRPFCSERCKHTDFIAWADEKYTVPEHQDFPVFDGSVPLEEDDSDRLA